MKSSLGVAILAFQCLLCCHCHAAVAQEASPQNTTNESAVTPSTASEIDSPAHRVHESGSQTGTEIGSHTIGSETTPPKRDAKTAEKKIRIGEQLFFNGNIDAALRAFEQAVALDPQNWQARLSLANLYVQKEKHNEAITQCEELLRERPTQKDVLLLLANLYRITGNTEAAKSRLQQSIKSGARPDLAHNSLAFILLGEGKLDESEEHVKEAIAENPKMAEAHLALALIKFKKNHPDDSLKELDLAISLKDKFTEAHNMKGDILASQGRWDEAIDSYKSALKFDPRYSQAYASLGIAYAKTGKLDEARHAFEKAQVFKPQDKNILYGLAAMLEKEGRTQEAITEFQKASLIETDAAMAENIRKHVAELMANDTLKTDVSLPELSPSKPGDVFLLNAPSPVNDPLAKFASDLMKIKQTSK